jgi:hypothetical protein
MLLDTGREVGTGASRVLFLIGLPLFAPLEPRGVLFVAMLLLGYFAAAAKRVICTQSRTAARDAVLFRDNSLFQLHEEQDEDRPHPYRYWKLRCLCIAQERTSSWKRKTKQVATAVSIPRTNLLFQVIFMLPRFQLPMCWVCVLAPVAMLSRIEIEVNSLTG